MKIVSATIFIAVLLSCGQQKNDTSDDNVVCSGQDCIQNLWTSSSGTVITINLSQTPVNGVVDPVSFSFNTGEICYCSATLVGNETSGTASFSLCYYLSGGAGDPGCAAMGGSGSYTVSGSTLTLCKPGCTTWNR
jgi:V8-like Glu-specific endopeptidase